MPETAAADRAPVSGGWITRYGFMWLAQNVSWATPSTILIANQILDWYPDSKETRFGWLMAAGGLASVLAAPAVGLLSDRTSTRFGRRTPAIVVGGLGAALALVLAAFVGGFWALLCAWLVFQVMIQLSLTASQSLPPDQVPTRQYGIVSGVMGVTYTLAVVLGTVIGASMGIRTAYLVTAAVLVLGIAPFVWLDREPPLPPAERISLKGRLLPSWHTASDFYWVFITRLLVTMSQALSLFYLVYFLRDRIKYDDPNQGVMLLSIAYAGCVLVTAIWSGRASDRVGRRKPFVALSSYGVAVATAVVAFAQSFEVVLIGAVVLGISWGVYQAIDQALINEVLPSDETRAKDMGLVNLAVLIPNTAAPLLAAGLLSALGGYSGIYLCAGVLALLGGVLVRNVRKVD